MMSHSGVERGVGLRRDEYSNWGLLIKPKCRLVVLSNAAFGNLRIVCHLCS